MTFSLVFKKLTFVKFSLQLSLLQGCVTKKPYLEGLQIGKLSLHCILSRCSCLCWAVPKGKWKINQSAVHRIRNLRSEGGKGNFWGAKEKSVLFIILTEKWPKGESKGPFSTFVFGLAHYRVVFYGKVTVPAIRAISNDSSLFFSCLVGFLYNPIFLGRTFSSLSRLHKITPLFFYLNFSLL